MKILKGLCRSYIYSFQVPLCDYNSVTCNHPQQNQHDHVILMFLWREKHISKPCFQFYNCHLSGIRFRFFTIVWYYSSFPFFVDWLFCCVLIVCLIFSMHLWLTLTVFLFNTSCRLLNFGKCLSNNRTNIFAALVVPFVLNRGLITVISLCLFSVFYWRMFGRVFLTRFIVIFYCVKNALILRIQSECWKMWTRITPNTDTFFVGWFSNRWVMYI